MEKASRVESLPVPGGRIERYSLPGGPGVPLLVVGGVETGLRLLAGTEALLAKRWEGRRRARPVVVVGRPIPDDPADANVLLHPRVSAAAIAVALTASGGPDVPVAIEAESGGGRISLWLTVDYPALVTRLVLAASAAETPADSAMAPRMAEWIGLGEQGEWGEFFGRMALQMRPGGETSDAPPAGSFAAAASLQPMPATPERFLAELRGTLDPSSFVTAHLREDPGADPGAGRRPGPGGAAVRPPGWWRSTSPGHGWRWTRTAGTPSAPRSVATTSWSRPSWPRATGGRPRPPRPGSGPPPRLRPGPAPPRLVPGAGRATGAPGPRRRSRPTRGT